ncbi:hypothetical protein NBRC116590_18050 [Pelagimonas sp. KU-00592-HH]
MSRKKSLLGKTLEILFIEFSSNLEVAQGFKQNIGVNTSFELSGSSDTARSSEGLKKTVGTYEEFQISTDNLSQS